MLCILALCLCKPALADTENVRVKPLYSFNQGPLIQIFGLPALGESRILGPDETAFAAHLTISNNFTGSSNERETLSLDGETRRLTLQWRQGLPRSKEWGIELPYVSHNGGFLDKSIEEFHDIFGLTQNGRTDLPRGRVDYRYSRHGVTLVNMNRAVSGLGDVRLSAAVPVVANSAGSGYTAAWRASLKLPTGDDNDLLGSGSTDLAGWLTAATTRPPDKGNLYAGGGLLIMTEGDVMPDLQRHFVGFGSLGLRQRIFPTVNFNAQLDVHSPFYSGSGFRQLGRYAVQGLLGVEWEFAPKKFLEFSISEDMVVGAAPDVAFNLSVSMLF